MPVACEAVIDDTAEDLYNRLHELVGRGGVLTYTAEKWLEELLQPLGYTRTDQSRVSHALKMLERAGLVKKSSVKMNGGYHASRRCNYPRPRMVDIEVLR